MNQIIYQETLGTFIHQCLVSRDIENRIKDKMYLAGYPSVESNWIISWKNSLPEIATALKESNISKDVDVAVEYRLSHSLERLDFLIYGYDESGNKNMVIVELKQWSSVERTASYNKVNTLVAKNHRDDHFHPSYQAQCYAGQLKSFNSYVQDEKVGIESCSFCHNMDVGYKTVMDDISLFPFVSESPSFLKDEGIRLKDFVERYVSKKCHSMLYEISNAKTIPSDNFAALMREALKGNQMYSLDSTQSEALTSIIDTVRHATYYNQKKTIIIKGGAGTGKSIIAINALGQLNSPKKKSDRITTMFVTVNAAPKKTLYAGLTKGKEFQKGELKNLFKYPSAFAGRPKNDIPCLLIDEAHRIFKMKGGVGLKAGTNMLKELINAALVSVFFIDDNQQICKDDYASIDLIQEVAKECHSEVIMGKNLELCGQYRVQGGAEYIQFIKTLLGYENGMARYSKQNNYDFRVYDDPNEMFDAVKQLDTEARNKQAEADGKLLNDISDYSGHCRLVAGYTYKWISSKEKRDGVLDVKIPEFNFAKKWNLLFGSGIEAYSWVDDPESIEEIGCIHTCQGIDLDYCGVIIGKDVGYEDGHIVFRKEAHPTTDNTGIRTANIFDAEKWIRNTYYVLLTRGIKGTFVFAEDEGLREYLKTIFE